MRFRRSDLIAALVTVVAMLVGACSAFDGGSSEAGGEEGEEEGGEFVDGPAPAGRNDRGAIRVDRVRVEDHELELELTIAVRRDLSFDESDIRLVTNNGLELPSSDSRDRTLTTRSTGTITLHTDGLVESARTVELSFPRLPSLTVDLPEGDGELRWAPAPLRQMAFEDVVVRSNALSMLPYTFRSEGLISEFTFLAVTRSSIYTADICDGDPPCRLQDSAGREYPRLGSGYENKRSDIQVRGTLRFLGQIPPDETELILVIRGLEFQITLPPGRGHGVVGGPQLQRARPLRRRRPFRGRGRLQPRDGRDRLLRGPDPSSRSRLRPPPRTPIPTPPRADGRCITSGVVSSAIRPGTRTSSWHRPVVPRPRFPPATHST